MANKKLVRPIVAFLVRPGISNYESVLKDSSGLQSYKLSGNAGINGMLYFKPQAFRAPAWLGFLQSGIDNPLPDIQSAGAAAVLVVEENARLFAITFGNGRHLLDLNCVERDFGLKVALNTIDPTRLRSMDIKTVSELTISTRRQTSHSSSLNTFGVDVTRDLLKAVTGEPRDNTFAKRLTGKDALALTAAMDFCDIAAKCRDMLAAYQEITYREHFAWIDHLREERDPSVLRRLEERLVLVLRARDLEKVHLAPPEPIEWDEVVEFEYSTAPDNALTDLDIEDYLGTVKALNALTVEQLKTHRIKAGTDSSQPRKNWKVYDCIVFEADFGDSEYVLSGGDWFRVDRDFASDVRDSLGVIPIADVNLPFVEPGEDEPSYNRRVAGRDLDLVCLDSDTIRIGNQTAIEACDLYSRSKQFIHVKRRSRSATLSHLFAQGMVSGQVFKEDKEFRSELRKRIERARPDLAGDIPTNRPSAADFEVVFAMLVKNSASDLRSLPFFSQIHLVHAFKYLQALDYRVSYRLIGERAS